MVSSSLSLSLSPSPSLHPSPSPLTFPLSSPGPRVAAVLGPDTDLPQLPAPLLCVQGGTQHAPQGRGIPHVDEGNQEAGPQPRACMMVPGRKADLLPKNASTS